jgi:hypothetical protein
MRRNLATALTILGMPVAAGHALAAEPAPAGATATVEIKMSVREKTVFNGQCVMEAGPASQVSSKGMTPEQQAAADASVAKAQQMQEQFGPSDEMLANLEAEAEKCGDDEACLTALAIRMSQTPEMQAMAKQVPEAQQAMQGMMPDLGPARYQMWVPQSCSGTVTVNDTYVETDPGGEGGDGAYTDTITAKGTAPVMPEWRGLYIETDVVEGATEYRQVAPPPVTVATSSSLTGAGEQQIPFLGDTALPKSFGPLKGVGGKQKAEAKGKAGSITVEWAWKK